MLTGHQLGVTGQKGSAVPSPQKQTKREQQLSVKSSTASTGRWSFLIYSMVTAHHLPKSYWGFKTRLGCMQSGGTLPEKSIIYDVVFYGFTPALPNSAGTVCFRFTQLNLKSQCFSWRVPSDFSRSCKGLRIKIPYFIEVNCASSSLLPHIPP